MGSPPYNSGSKEQREGIDEKWRGTKLGFG